MIIHIGLSLIQRCLNGAATVSVSQRTFPCGSSINTMRVKLQRIHYWAGSLGLGIAPHFSGQNTEHMGELRLSPTQRNLGRPRVVLFFRLIRLNVYIYFLHI